MRKHEIKVGSLYLAKVAGTVTTVRVDAIREGGGAVRLRPSLTRYDVTNLRTGRKTTFYSAAKFRGPAKDPTVEEQEAKERLAARGYMVGPLSGQTEPARMDDAEVDRLLASIQGEGEQRRPPTSGTPNSPALVAPAPPTSMIATSTTAPTPTIRPSSPVVAVAPPAGPANIGARMVAAHATRTAGTPVAGMVPNTEQEAILAVAATPDLEVLVVCAGAGTGKTATLKMLEQVLRGRGQYTAFNAPLVAEAKGKFVKAACNTTHSLAFRAVGKSYQHRLGGEKMRSYQIARILGIEDMTVLLKGMGEKDDQGKPTDKPKRLAADFLAGQVLVATRKFCQSTDREIGPEHLPHIAGIDFDGTRANNDAVQVYLLPFARKAWDDLANLNGQLPFSHDCYVKLWQLGTGNDRPIIGADYILLDEAQDTAPVFLDILKQQKHALLVFVGDSNQAIYEWRGAVDAMKAYPDAARRLLSQSYRFGQAVADVANAVLSTLDEPTDLRMRGNPALATRVEEVAEPRAYLYRTNAGAIGRVMASIAEGKRPCLVGGSNYVAEMVKWMQAAMDLQAKRGTRHPELACFDTWEEVVEYAATAEGADMALMCKLVKEFGAQAIRDALKDMPKEEDADVVVSTAHRSKGREWDTVKLGPDFPLANKMQDSDRRLLYVAATRAKMVLDITDCPPFCGGHDIYNNNQWVPGIRVTYTAPTSVVEEIPEKVADVPCFPKQDRYNDRNAPTGAAPEPKIEGKPMAVTYAKLRDDTWGLRAEGKLVPGASVKVTKRDGTTKTETVGRVVWTGNGVTLATIANVSGDNGRTNGSGRALCAECGRPGHLVSDLEDGLMKHPNCCDIAP